MSYKVPMIAAVMSAMYLWGVATNDDIPHIDTRGCQDAVKAALTAPATADLHDESVSKNDGFGFTVRGQVDSQNKFGATLSATYRCTVMMDGTVSGSPLVLEKDAR